MSKPVGLDALDGVPNTGLSDADALDVLRRLLSGQEWSPAADYLEAIAGVVQATGRDVDDYDPFDDPEEAADRDAWLKRLDPPTDDEV